MKRFLILITVSACASLLFNYSTTIAAPSDTKKAPSEKKVVKVSSLIKADGKVVSVDVSANTLVVNVGKGAAAFDVTYQVEAGAKIQCNGKAITLGELKIDSKVDIMYKIIDEIKIAVIINAKEPTSQAPIKK